MEPYIGEIKMVAGDFAPRNWAYCNGQSLSVGQNPSLSKVLGKTYGGDGKKTFNLPDMRGRTPVGWSGPDSTTYPLGKTGGVEGVALTPTQIPGHSHKVMARSRGENGEACADTARADGSMPASTLAAAVSPYAAAPSGEDGEEGELVALDARTVGTAGGGDAHSNIQPSLGIGFCIALAGIYPDRP